MTAVSKATSSAAKGFNCCGVDIVVEILGHLKLPAYLMPMPIALFRAEPSVKTVGIQGSNSLPFELLYLYPRS